MKRRLLAAILLSVVFVAGCQKNTIPGDPTPPTGTTFHQGARDAVVFAYGFISDLQSRHATECQAEPAKSVCVLITRGISVQRLSHTAINTYCAGPPAAGAQPYGQGGPCSPQAGLQSRLEAALADLSGIMTDIRKLN